MSPPSRTPGVLGRNDATESSANAPFGNTRCPLGVNDWAISQVNNSGLLPARILQTRNFAAAAKAVKVKVPRKLKITLPPTKKIERKFTGNTTGGGNFQVHKQGVDSAGKTKDKPPDVEVSFDKSAFVYRIDKIAIHTQTYVKNPDPNAYPVVGKNVTNNKVDGVRTPDTWKGKGYWKKVIENMKTYEYGGQSNPRPHPKWYVKGSTAYHEEIHNQQFRSWIKKNTFFLLRKLEINLNDSLKQKTRITKQDVEYNAKIETRRLINDGFGDPDANEKEAYRKTYQKIWMPEIKKIEQDAKSRGWK